MNRLYKLLYLLLLLPAVVYAQYSWNHHINRQDITELLIDGQYLWMTTSRTGLVRWNTSTEEQQVFDRDNGFFSDSSIKLALDSSGAVWAASGSTIAQYRNGSFGQQFHFSSRVNDLTVDYFGAVWVGISDGILKQSGTTFERVTAFDELRGTDEYVDNVVSGGADSCVYVRVNNRVFRFGVDGQYHQTIELPFVDSWSMAVRRGELFVTDISNVAVYDGEDWRLFSTNDGTLSNAVLGFSVSAQGDIWAYGQNVMAFENEKWDVRLQYERGDSRIRAIAPVSGNIAWVGGDYFFGKLVWGELQPISTNSPANNMIEYIYADYDGSVWVRCSDGKNVISKYNGSEWSHPYTRPFTDMLRTQDSTYYFIENTNVHVFGVVRNGVRVNDLRGNEFIPSGNINAIAEDHLGKIWYATSKGVIRNYSDTLFSSDNSGFASSHINTILATSVSSLWIGGRDGTLAFYKDGSWTTSNLPQKHTITALAQDSGGGIWIGTDAGVFKISSHLNEQYPKETGSPPDKVTSIAIDHNNRVWVGTINGLSYFEDDNWSTLLRSDGITSTMVTSLDISIDSVLWIGTYDRGISTLDLSSKPMRGRAFMSKTTKHCENKLLNRKIYLRNAKPYLENRKVYLLNGRKVNPHTTNRSLPSNLYLLEQINKKLE
ncbi:two-component regulator propeller domain-containing protein [Chitinispirillales bacterium ANBcel5]|uniref:ligand-binding sensor domain-containing protein n=1 Tax=Cellulosispirillum alkaliphilum TaxID=3039283 RepID=UPI002A58A659|nr:two-component regulator propeller domain-containing protein [Chitinispirillales bacterium ANBcel5]